MPLGLCRGLKRKENNNLSLAAQAGRCDSCNDKGRTEEGNPPSIALIISDLSRKGKSNS